MELGGELPAVHAASHFRFLRSKGKTVRGVIDLLIATWCIEHDVPLLHADRDFEGFETHLGLKRWPLPPRLPRAALLQCKCALHHTHRGEHGENEQHDIAEHGRVSALEGPGANPYAKQQWWQEQHGMDSCIVGDEAFA